jgi:glycosyltransferase involved in cell wall biosynthesis
VEDLRTAMQQALRDAVLGATLRQRGVARAAEFSWEKCAKRTRAVYQELL